MEGLFPLLAHGLTIIEIQRFRTGHQPLVANQAGSGMVLLCFPSLGRHFLPGGNYILSEVPKVDVKWGQDVC